MKTNIGPWKCLIYILFIALFKKLSYMCCQRQKETALMIEGGDGVARKKTWRVLMRSLEPCAGQFS